MNGLTMSDFPLPEVETATSARLRHPVEDYRSGDSFFFASPRQIVLADGVAVALPHRPDDLTHYIPELLTALEETRIPQVVVGALPFDERAPAQLVVPAVFRRAESFGQRVVPSTRPPADLVAVSEADPDAFTRAVATALTRIGQRQLEKVVLARTVDFAAGAPLEVAALVRRLVAAEPLSHTFAVDLPGERVLIGASPELLVRRTGRKVFCHPLAGSAARSPDPVDDARRAAALVTSAKDRHEHALVVAGVVDALTPLCDDVCFPKEPSVIATATMWHLGTRVTATVSDPEVSALVLAGALHPTPAICGVPLREARAAIEELESFDRGFYGGMVGWMDAEGNGEWALSIRCAEVSGSRIRLFAGAGVVAGSDPEGELAETEAKFSTLRRALGLPAEESEVGG